MRHTIVAGTAAVLSIVAVLGARASEGRLSAIAVENLRAPAAGWLAPDASGRTIEVYASQTDVAPGQELDVHVSAVPAARYRVLVYRLGWYGGVGARLAACSPGCNTAGDATPQPVPAPDGAGKVDAGWPVTDRIPVDDSWTSGYYLVRVLLLSGPARGRSATTYVVARQPRNAAKVLVVVPESTWQAYNGWGGKSMYPFSSADGRQAYRVSFDRPYAWTMPGGQRPLGWELPVVRFLERRGYDIAYQSDIATALHPRSLLRHRLVVVPGHSEYWTGRMRTAFETARDAGVNLAFMGANDAYWQVRYEDAGRTIMSYKSLYDPNPDATQKTAMFRELTPPRYECGLIGIQHQGAGLQWHPGDYTVVPAALDHPWMRAAGFRRGDTIPGIVSVESDTIPGNQTAASSCGHALTVFFHRQRGGDKDGNADATLYTAPSGARVFASGSHQFSWALDDFATDPDEGHGYADVRMQRFMAAAFDDLSR